MSTNVTMESAAEFANSTRGRYIISQALTKAIEVMEKVPSPHTEHSNIADMKALQVVFPLFQDIQDATDKNQRELFGNQDD